MATESDKDYNQRGFFDGFFSAKPTGSFPFRLFQLLLRINDLSLQILANVHKDAKPNTESPAWKSPFGGECDQDEMDRLRADCEV